MWTISGVIGRLLVAIAAAKSERTFRSRRNQHKFISGMSPSAAQGS
jgi:hypothetical protein